MDGTFPFSPSTPFFFLPRVLFFRSSVHRGTRRTPKGGSRVVARAEKKKKSQARLVSEHAKERCEKRSLAPRESRTGSRSFLRQTLRAYLIVLFVNATRRTA